MSYAPFSPEWIVRSLEILDCYSRLLGKELVSREGSAENQARRLFEAPFVVAAHGTQEDPILNYGNQTALNLWEADLEAFLSMPSRLTAEPMEREERARMLAETQSKGFTNDYRGVRISTTGKRFQIDQATVWNLTDKEGNSAGQAATFAEWTFLG